MSPIQCSAPPLTAVPSRQDPTAYVRVALQVRTCACGERSIDRSGPGSAEVRPGGTRRAHRKLHGRAASHHGGEPASPAPLLRFRVCSVSLNPEPEQLDLGDFEILTVYALSLVCL